MKTFDRTYSDFANESRNDRLGLCVDGFTSIYILATPYSSWSVFGTPYIFLLEMCMTSPYLFFTCIILDPRNTKSLIDIYLLPFILGLQIL